MDFTEPVMKQMLATMRSRAGEERGRLDAMIVKQARGEPLYFQHVYNGFTRKADIVPRRFFEWSTAGMSPHDAIDWYETKAAQLAQQMEAQNV